MSSRGFLQVVGSPGGNLKRLDARARERLIRIAKLRAASSLRELRKRAERHRYGLSFGVERRREPKPHSVFIEAPKVLSIAPEHFEDCADFLDRVRAAAFAERPEGEPEREVLLDLRKCELVSPEIAPLLVAEIQRIRFFKGKRSVTGLSPLDPVARRALHAMGVFEFLNIRDPKSDREGDDTRAIFHIESGIALEGDVTKRIAESIGADVGLGPEQTEIVQKALNEALENISEHAYADPELLSYPAETGRWWICSVTSSQAKGAHLLACDLGSTIPATVPKTAAKAGQSNMEALAKILSGEGTDTREQRLLGAAFEEGVTRRPSGKGGNGLGKMVQLVQELPTGGLTVISGGAAALFRRGFTKVKTAALARRLPGTYVFWTLGKEPK